MGIAQLSAGGYDGGTTCLAVRTCRVLRPSLPRFRCVVRGLLLSALLTLPMHFAHAGTRNPEDYPLQVHVYSRHVSHDKKFAAWYGEGKANLVEGSQIHAIDFSYRCGFKLEDNDEGESFNARWLKPGLKLQILTGVYGSDRRTEVCDFDVAVKEFVYAREHGHIVQLTPAEYAQRSQAAQEHAQAVQPTDLDPSHYPLQLALLHIAWTSSLNGVEIGSGQGNLRSGNSLNAVDFSLHCPVKIQPTPDGRYLLGKWLQPGNRLLLLLRPIDVDGAPGATCEVLTAVEPDVYIRSGNNVRAVSQQEYAQKSASSLP
jgi:hypothetical protein